MPGRMQDSEIRALIDRVLKLGRETSWIEWKQNNSDPDRVGKYCSALANAAAMANLPYGVVIWGIDDTSGNITGTDFHPSDRHIGNADYHIWLQSNLSHSQGFEFYESYIGDHRLVILVVQAAQQFPVRFKKDVYIRKGAHLTPVKDSPEIERQLWDILLSERADTSVAADNLTTEEIHTLLDTSSLPSHMMIRGTNSADQLEANNLIQQQPSGRYAIDTATALVFARNLNDFPSLSRKRIRFLIYEKDNKVELSQDLSDDRGYARAFPSTYDHVLLLMPKQEVSMGAQHHVMDSFSALAIREMLGNALIHQDLRAKGAGPIIEMFPNRIEITNPGEPIIPVQRLLDYPPRSRNEKLATLMRKLGLCEERGSGWDKIVQECARLQLPGPALETLDTDFRVTLLPHQEVSQMTRYQKNWSLYLHVSFRYMQHENTANQHVRERFGIHSRNAAVASRILGDAVRSGLIKLADPNASRKQAEYVPFWA